MVTTPANGSVHTNQMLTRPHATALVFHGGFTNVHTWMAARMISTICPLQWSHQYPHNLPASRVGSGAACELRLLPMNTHVTLG